MRLVSCQKLIFLSVKELDLIWDDITDAQGQTMTVLN